MRNKRTNVQTAAWQKKTLHKNLSFTAAEAYKLLRTNVLFALPGEDEKKCRIIGVTSSVRGEGKSTTSINLAYVLGEMGKKVLLIEGDMRLPSFSVKMDIRNSPGLSNVLVASGSEAGITLHPSGVFPNWKIVTAGDLPPNPSELLGSKRMRSVLKVLSGEFDFIVVDLPPVNVVSDALVLSPLMDGYVVVVKENYTDRKELRTCIRQLNMANAKILGILMTGVKENKKRYGKYQKYYQTSGDAGK